MSHQNIRSKKFTGKMLQDALAHAAKPPIGGRGINVKSGGVDAVIVNTQPDPRRAVIYPVKITGSVPDPRNVRKLAYEWTEQFKTDVGHAGWANREVPRTHVTRGLARNLADVVGGTRDVPNDSVVWLTEVRVIIPAGEGGFVGPFPGGGIEQLPPGGGISQGPGGGLETAARSLREWWFSFTGVSLIHALVTSFTPPAPADNKWTYGWNQAEDVGGVWSIVVGGLSDATLGVARNKGEQLNTATVAAHGVDLTAGGVATGTVLPIPVNAPIDIHLGDDPWFSEVNAINFTCAAPLVEPQSEVPRRGGR